MRYRANGEDLYRESELRIARWHSFVKGFAVGIAFMLLAAWVGA